MQREGCQTTVVGRRSLFARATAWGICSLVARMAFSRAAGIGDCSAAEARYSLAPLRRASARSSLAMGSSFQAAGLAISH
jgi:hypothetical protein